MDLRIDKSSFENADVMVVFKMTKSERVELQKLADKYNTTVSKLVRQILIKYMETNEA